MTAIVIWLAEHGWLPDALIRRGIRQLLASRLREMRLIAGPNATAYEGAFADGLSQRAMAEDTAAANAQHYELPTAFFKTILGPRLKYSAAFFPASDTSLAEAENRMLAMTATRAELENGQEVLELGCGWGSLTLWMAERYPHSRITAVTNSSTQAAYVQAEARARGLNGVRVLRANVADFLTDQTYDRIVSVEMFEHVRNYAQLFARIRTWLNPGGKLFVHVFAHRHVPYLFEVDGADNWMGRYFFTGGTMPSFGLLPRFARDMPLDASWWIDGRHYARTLEAWLANLDRNRRKVLDLFRDTYGRRAARVWVRRWRLFILACAELFAYRDGGEWGLAHYSFTCPVAGADTVSAKKRTEERGRETSS